MYRSLYLKAERNVFKTKNAPMEHICRPKAGQAHKKLLQTQEQVWDRGNASRPRRAALLRPRSKRRKHEALSLVHVVPRLCHLIAQISHWHKQPFINTKKNIREKVRLREELLEVTWLGPEVTSLPPQQRHQHPQIFVEAVKAQELELNIKSRVVDWWE